jgi:hypothetical protein
MTAQQETHQEMSQRTVLHANLLMDVLDKETAMLKTFSS